MIVQAAPMEHASWLAQRAEFVPTPMFKGIEAIDPISYAIKGMAGFDGWTANCVVVTIALDSPVAFRHLLPAIFDYAFNQTGRGVMLATVRGTNAKSYRLCKHVGFREAYRVKDGVAVGEDLVLMEMRREECRWLQRKAA